MDKESEVTPIPRQPLPADHALGGIAEMSIAGLAGIPTELTTHAGLPTVHQDAPALIATHAGLFSELHGLTVVRKTADQTVNNSVALVNDTHLLFAVGANEVWRFEFYIFYITTGVADIKYCFTLPGGAVCSAILYSGGNVDNPVVDLTAVMVVMNTGANAFIHCPALYVGAGNAGNVQLQWAQNTAEATDTKVLINSFILAHRLA